MHADSEFDAPVLRDALVARDHAFLDRGRTGHGIYHASKLHQCAVAHKLDDTAVMSGNFSID